MESLKCSILYAYSLLPISYSRLLDELCCKTATFIKSNLGSDSPTVSTVARHGI